MRAILKFLLKILRQFFHVPRQDENLRVFSVGSLVLIFPFQDDVLLLHNLI
jgi:hypothetical protein